MPCWRLFDKCVWKTSATCCTKYIFRECRESYVKQNATYGILGDKMSLLLCALLRVMIQVADANLSVFQSPRPITVQCDHVSAYSNNWTEHVSVIWIHLVYAPLRMFWISLSQLRHICLCSVKVICTAIHLDTENDKKGQWKHAKRFCKIVGKWRLDVRHYASVFTNVCRLIA